MARSVRGSLWRSSAARIADGSEDGIGGVALAVPKIIAVPGVHLSITSSQNSGEAIFYTKRYKKRG